LSFPISSSYYEALVDLLRKKNVALIERTLASIEHLVLDAAACLVVIPIARLNEYDGVDLDLLFKNYSRIWIIIAVNPER
jgi:hypothetical protein